MNLVDRAKNICLTPKTEWLVIAGEVETPQALITDYVAPLAAIGAVAGFIGSSIVGVSLPFLGTYRTPLIAGLTVAIFGFVMAIVGVFVLSYIINALAPTFGGQQSTAMALKIAVYSYTPAWIAGVLRIVPSLGLLIVLAALYSLYLLYLGLPRLMKCPEDKAIGYTAVIVICAIVFGIIVASITALFAGAGMIGSRPYGAAFPGSSRGSDVEFSRDSPAGKLQEMSKKLEENNRTMEAARKNGDSAGQMTAAMASLGTILGGGKRVDPIGVDQLKPFVPDTFAGLPRRSSNVEKNGIAGLMVSKADATFGDGAGKSVRLEISDTGGVSGLVGLAGWVGVQGEKEDDNGIERTQKINGRLVHEKTSKRGGSNEYGIVLGERFIVSASGSGVDLDQLKTAVANLDLGKLESMKGAGVQN
jgi:hypothetical protein